MKVYEVHQITLTQDEYDNLPEQVKVLFTEENTLGYAPGEQTHQILTDTGETAKSRIKFIQNIKNINGGKYAGKKFVIIPEKFKPFNVTTKTQTIIQF